MTHEEHLLAQAHLPDRDVLRDRPALPSFLQERAGRSCAGWREVSHHPLGAHHGELAHLHSVDLEAVRAKRRAPAEDLTSDALALLPNVHLRERDGHSGDGCAHQHLSRDRHPLLRRVPLVGRPALGFRARYRLSVAVQGLIRPPDPTDRRRDALRLESHHLPG